MFLPSPSCSRSAGNRASSSDIAGTPQSLAWCRRTGRREPLPETPTGRINQPSTQPAEHRRGLRAQQFRSNLSRKHERQTRGEGPRVCCGRQSAWHKPSPADNPLPPSGAHEQTPPRAHQSETGLLHMFPDRDPIVGRGKCSRKIFTLGVQKVSPR